MAFLTLRMPHQLPNRTVAFNGGLLHRATHPALASAAPAVVDSADPAERGGGKPGLRYSVRWIALHTITRSHSLIGVRTSNRKLRVVPFAARGCQCCLCPASHYYMNKQLMFRVTVMLDGNAAGLLARLQLDAQPAGRHRDRPAAGREDAEATGTPEQAQSGSRGCRRQEIGETKEGDYQILCSSQRGGPTPPPLLLLRVCTALTPSPNCRPRPPSPPPRRAQKVRWAHLHRDSSGSGRWSAEEICNRDERASSPLLSCHLRRQTELVNQPDPAAAAASRRRLVRPAAAAASATAERCWVAAVR